MQACETAEDVPMINHSKEESQEFEIFSSSLSLKSDFFISTNLNKSNIY